MISSLDPGSSAFLTGIDQIQRRSARAQRELTTGLRINSVADDPSRIPQLLATRAQLDHTQQIGQNLSRVKAEVDAAESSLGSAVQLVDRAQSLATQGQTALATADGRRQIAGQIGDILQQLVSVANTKVEGRSIFSGDSDQTTPYSVDLSKANPVSAYAGSAATRQIEQPDGTLFAVSKNAREIFDGPGAGQSVFQAITGLRTALQNNDQQGINAGLASLQTAGSYLNTQLAFYGVTQNNVSDGQNAASDLTTQLKSRLSGIQDADLTESIADFQQAATQQQAALASRAKLPRSSLFDYLG